MASKDTSRQLSTAPTTIPIALGQGGQLDLSSLPEDQRQALLIDHARGVLDVNRKALELSVEATGLKATLGTLADTTKQVADAGNSVTLKHEHRSSTGRTEAVLGNTPEAEKGTTGWTFGGDSKIFLLIGGLIVVAIIIALAFRG